MKTVEEIQRERGLDIRPIDWDRSAPIRGCGFNPSKEGARENDCGKAASWHARVISERVDTGVTLIACEGAPRRDHDRLRGGLPQPPRVR